MRSAPITIFEPCHHPPLTMLDSSSSESASSSIKNPQVCLKCSNDPNMGSKLCCCCQSIDEQNEQLSDVILSRQPPQSEQCRGNLLVFINPNSGKGESLETFAQTVAPKLDRNLIRYEVVITKGPNHAKNVLMTKTDLGKFNGVLILSGDGLVFEALNGILGREDAFRVFPCLPIGIVPLGSGNGLICSILAKYGEKLDPKTIMDRSLEMTTKSTAKAEPVSLFSVKTETQNFAMFLSIGWGLMADIDIESEKWRRSLGAHRFVLGGFIRSIALRTYRGRLTYRPHKPYNYTQSDQKYGVYEKTMRERIDDLEGECGSEGCSSPPVKHWSIHDPLDCDSSDLITIEDEFVNVYAVTLSHISSDGPYAPVAKLGDNKIHLSYILKKDIGTRLDVARFLLAIEHEQHLEMPFVNRVEASYMSLDVLSDGSYVVIDGEVVDTKSLTVSSTRNNLCVFSPSD